MIFFYKNFGLHLFKINIFKETAKACQMIDKTKDVLLLIVLRAVNYSNNLIIIEAISHL